MVAEGILEAAKGINTHPDKLHEDNDPYVVVIPSCEE